jgi:protein-tyrosine-phosphatase
MHRDLDEPPIQDGRLLLLVVCTGNICRSPMAEGLLAARLAAAGLTGWAVQSRGVHAVVGCPATAEAVRALAELGLDIRGHRGRLLTARDARAAELILTLEEWHRDSIRSRLPGEAEKVQLLTHYRAAQPDQDIADPYGRPYSVYAACRDEIAEAVEALVGHLRSRSGPQVG